MARMVWRMGNGVEDYGMQESGIWDSHLKNNGM